MRSPLAGACKLVLAHDVIARIGGDTFALILVRSGRRL